MPLMIYIYMYLKDELDREHQMGGMGLKLTLYYVNEIIYVLQLGLLGTSCN